jgi:hypothetical protein
MFWLDDPRSPLKSRGRLGVLLVAALGVACESVPLMNPDGTTHILLQANPSFVVANGGRSLVTAVLTEPAGTFVPDGTEVFFFTTLGQIDERARTVNGLARVYFVADARSGHASVTAYSGGPAPAPSPSPPAGPLSGDGSVTIKIDVGGALPALLILGANPQRITNPRRSTITATVFDAFGNPVQNVPVIFTVSATLLEETLDSGGTQVYTDSNGQAFDTLRTRRLPTDSPKPVTVTATVPVTGVTAGTVTVTVN